MALILSSYISYLLRKKTEAAQVLEELKKGSDRLCSRFLHIASIIMAFSITFLIIISRCALLLFNSSILNFVYIAALVFFSLWTIELFRSSCRSTICVLMLYNDTDLKQNKFNVFFKHLTCFPRLFWISFCNSVSITLGLGEVYYIYKNINDGKNFSWLDIGKSALSFICLYLATVVFGFEHETIISEVFDENSIKNVDKSRDKESSSSNSPSTENLIDKANVNQSKRLSFEKLGFGISSFLSIFFFFLGLSHVTFQIFSPNRFPDVAGVIRSSFLDPNLTRMISERQLYEYVILTLMTLLFYLVITCLRIQSTSSEENKKDPGVNPSSTLISTAQIQT